MDSSYSLATSRSRRSQNDKTGRKTLLAQLKEAKSKGERLKLSKEDTNVYDEIDESEYSELVQQRLDDDFIVGDLDGTYQDDGREIFDWDENADKSSKADSKKMKSLDKREIDRKRHKNDIRRCADDLGKKSGDIKSMFQAATMQKSANKKKEEISLEGDSNLDDLLQELSSDRPKSSGKYPSSQNRSKQIQPKLTPRPNLSLDNKHSNKIEFNHCNSVTDNRTKIGDTVSTKSSNKTANPFKNKKSGGESSVKFRLDQSNNESIQSKNAEAVVSLASMDVDVPEVEPNTNNDNADIMDYSDVNFDEDFITDDCQTDSNEIKKEKLDNNFVCPTISSNWLEDEEIMNSSDNTNVLDNALMSSADKNVFRFYWLDAFEDTKTMPGIVFIFGKTFVEESGSYSSCCLRVKDLPRRVYFLPRFDVINPETNAPYTTKDVYDELLTLFPAQKIEKFKCRPTVREYAFEYSDVPSSGEYLEVLYGASMPALSPNFSGKSFSRVFGTNTSFLESLILEKKLKGPCWLDIISPTHVRPQFSWSKLDLEISGTKSLTRTAEPQPPLPPLVLLALTVKTVSSQRDNQNEIVSVGCLIHKEFFMDRPPPKKLFQNHFGIVTHPRDCVFPYDFRQKIATWGPQYKFVDIEGSERALLGRLLARIQNLDPDLILGQDLFGYELTLLLQRLQFHRVPHWHRVGRLKRANLTLKFSGSASHWQEKVAMAGRIVCDTNISSKELIRARSYELGELAKQVLSVERIVPVESGDLRSLFFKSEDLRRLIDFTFNDAHIVLRLAHELQVLPLALQITGICGNLLSRTLSGGRAERNEYLLLHAFNEKGYIPPDKASHYNSAAAPANGSSFDMDEAITTGIEKSTGKKRRKPAYTGGLVLEPKKGFYDRFILLLDFNSLYPSIIQEYNICFTTVSRSESHRIMNPNDEQDSLILPELPDSSLPPGILPTEIRKLVESRGEIKKLIASGNASGNVSQEQMAQWDIRQKALKLTANSMYGCLGFADSRFYAKPLAALVTYKGREILMSAKNLVESMNLEVIYGDTDSIMVNTNCLDYDQVMTLGKKIKTEVNKLYRLLELDIDGVFQTMLLLKKKKYAALAIVGKSDGKLITKKEMKGLDIVRRDWSALAVEAGEFVVSAILSGDAAGDREELLNSIHSYLEKLGNDLDQNNVPLQKFIITKSLTRNPENYADSKSLPHVQVAMRLNASSESGKKLGAGDTVEYVVCKDGSDLPAAQRAYSPREVNDKSGSLVIDTHYYKSHQIHPVVRRLCEPIEGTDAARIAQCLGLDPSGYSRKDYDDGEETMQDAEERAMLGEAEKWADCDPLELSCPYCSQTISIKETMWNPKKLSSVSWKCPHCNRPMNDESKRGIVSLTNQIELRIRSLIRQYYTCWSVCEDSACALRTRHSLLPGQRSENAQSIGMRGPLCWQCHQALLRRQLSDARLYRQLAFFSHLCQTSTETKKVISQDDRLLSDSFTEKIDKYLSKSAFAVVDLSRLFSGLLAK